MTEPSRADLMEFFRTIQRTVALAQVELSHVINEHSDLSRIQFDILHALEPHQDGMRMHELADYLVMSRSGLTYQASQLEKLGLLRRVTASDNERAVLAVITDRGMQELEAVKQAQLTLVSDVLLPSIQADELPVLARLYERLGDMLQTRAQQRREAQNS